MRKTIIFDFDGTIADTFPVVEGIAHEIAGRNGIEVTTEEARAIGLQQVLKKSKFPAYRIPQLLIEVKQRLGLKIRDEVNPFEDMGRVLHRLAENYDLGIVSSNSESNIKIFLEKHHFLGLFRYIHSDSSLFGKHTVLQRFCRKYNVKSESIIYIGDEDRDIQAAKKLKIRVIAVTWGYNDKALLAKEKPDCLAEKPEEILEWLKLSS